MFKPYIIALHKTYGWRIIPDQDVQQLCRTNDALLRLFQIENDQDELIFSTWRQRDAWLIEKARRMGYGGVQC